MPKNSHNLLFIIVSIVEVFFSRRPHANIERMLIFPPMGPLDYICPCAPLSFFNTSSISSLTMVISYSSRPSRRVMANPPDPIMPLPTIPPMSRQVYRSSCTLIWHHRLFIPSFRIILCRYLNFQSVQMEHIYQRCWIIRAKVMWKSHIRVHAMGNPYFRCILLDQEVWD